MLMLTQKNKRILELYRPRDLSKSGRKALFSRPLIGLSAIEPSTKS